MKRSELGPGQKALERGSTFANRGSGPSRNPEKQLATRKPMASPSRVISPASPEQRKKIRAEPCVVTGKTADGGWLIDPAHLCARAQGGCDDADCVVPLWRPLHRDFDEGLLDLLPSLVGRRTSELCHALAHYDGDVVGLLRRLTGDRYVPEKAA